MSLLKVPFKMLLSVIAVVASCCLVGANGSQLPEENLREIPEMSVPDLIKYWGYPVEEHWVTTEDGYILGLHRIPHGRTGGGGGEPRPVAYLQHGLTSSSASWTSGPPEKSLGYVLADEGFDVWMGNSRGNSYSRNHTFLDVCSGANCKEFWDFGWHEGGLYDVSAGIDYALNVSQQEKVYYVGHSMGTTQYLVLLASMPEYNQKIKVGALMAPPAFMSHSTNVMFDIASLADGVELLYHLLGLYEFLPHSDFLSWIAHNFCGDDHPLSGQLCLNAALALFGFNAEYMNNTMIPTYLDHIPEGTSTRTAAHYAQLYLSHNFEAYDFGANENIERYGQATPPTYDLSQVTAPTAIFKGDHDSLVNLIDVDILVAALPNVILDHLVDRTGWSHFCYILAMDADTMVYDLIVDTFKEYM